MFSWSVIENSIIRTDVFKNRKTERFILSHFRYTVRIVFSSFTVSEEHFIFYFYYYF